MQDCREDKQNYPSFIQFGYKKKEDYRSKYGVRTYGKVKYAGKDYYLSFSMMGTAKDSTPCSLTEVEFFKRKVKNVNPNQMKQFHGKILIDCEIMQTLKDLPDLQYTELSDDLANYINLPDQIEISKHVFTKKDENYVSSNCKVAKYLKAKYYTRTGKKNVFRMEDQKCITSADALNNKNNILLTQDMIKFPFISIDVDKFKKDSFSSEQNLEEKKGTSVSNQIEFTQVSELNTIASDEVDNLEIYDRVGPSEILQQSEANINAQDPICAFTFLNTPNYASTAVKAQGEAISGCELINEQTVWLEQEMKPVENDFKNSLVPNAECIDEYLFSCNTEFDSANSVSFIYPDSYTSFPQSVQEKPSQGPSWNSENLDPISNSFFPLNAESGHGSKRNLSIDIVEELTKRRRTDPQLFFQSTGLFSNNMTTENRISIVEKEIAKLKLDKQTLLKLKNSFILENIPIDKHCYESLSPHVNTIKGPQKHVQKQTGIKAAYKKGYLQVDSQPFLNFYCKVWNIDIDKLEPILNHPSTQVPSNS